jgi:ATP-dependent protease HslVU (ClpYQ), peptidase subunit
MTTIIAVKRDGVVVMGGDGQVTLGSSVLKHGAKKVRKIYNGSVLVGFAAPPLTDLL